MKLAFKHSIPVAFGYIPLGIAFGILFNQTGYHYIYVILMAIFIFAGSAQFLAVGMIANHAGLLEVFITTLLLNLRHIFYGLYALNLYEKVPFLKRIYAMQALTDETFSIVSTLPSELKQDTSFLLRLSIVNHLWWIFGCSIGAILGSVANINIPGLEFALTALFIVLLLEQYFKSKELTPIFIATLASAIVILSLPSRHFLIFSLTISSLLFLGVKYYAKLSR
jgi:4-azaleucine resistance transporter AzlC